MANIDIFKSMRDSSQNNSKRAPVSPEVKERKNLISHHTSWLKSFNREYPSPYQFFKVAVYIRYYNQTKYENYLEYHKMQFADIIAQCPNWIFVDYYIDEGATAPKMESAPEWSRLLNDCMDGNVDLILTQKVKNISNDINEITFCSRLLATQNHPIGIYFIGEDIYTLASYYKDDLHDKVFLPSEDWQCLPEDLEDHCEVLEEHTLRENSNESNEI